MNITEKLAEALRTLQDAPQIVDVPACGPHYDSIVASQHMAREALAKAREALAEYDAQREAE